MYKNVWIETYNSFGEKVAHRRSGDRAVGKALWSAKRSASGKDIYKWMRSVKAGDIILHFDKDKKILEGSSVVVSKQYEEVDGIKDSNFPPLANNEKYILWRLGRFEKLKYPILLLDEINKDENFELLITIKDGYKKELKSGFQDVFYRNATALQKTNFRLKQSGLYPVGKTLLTFINNIYGQKTVRNIPHVNSELLWPNYTDLLENLYLDEENIREENKDIGGKNDQKIQIHNSGTEVLKEGLKKMGFNHVHNLIKKESGGDIDIACLYEKTLFLIEYKTGKNCLSSSAIRTWNTKNDEDINYLYLNKTLKTPGHRDGILNPFNRKFKSVVCLYVVYSGHGIPAKNIESIVTTKLKEHTDKDRIKEKGSMIKVENKEILRVCDTFVHEQQFTESYFDYSEKIDGKYAQRIMLSDFGVNPDKEDYLKVPAIQIEIKHSKEDNYFVYNFSCSPREIMKFASVSRRGPVKEGSTHYQRMLDADRVDDIGKNFIVKNEGYFANNIVIKLDDDKTDFLSFKQKAYDGLSDSVLEKIQSSTSSSNDIGLLTIKQDFDSAWIIDGQHRLFSYLKTTKDDKINNSINVAALVKVTAKREAEYFLHINDEQKPVDKDLIWDLNGVIKPDSKEGIVSNACKFMYDFEHETFKNSPKNLNLYFRNIKIPSRGLKKRTYKLSTLCNNLYNHDYGGGMLEKKYKKFLGDGEKRKSISNPFYNDDKQKMSKNLGTGFANFFALLQKELGEEWINEHRFFNDTIVREIFTVAKYYFQHFEIKDPHKEKEFFKVFSKILKGLNKEQINIYKKNQNMVLRQETLSDWFYLLSEKFSNFAPIKEMKLVKDIRKFSEGQFALYVYKKIENEFGVNCFLKNDQLSKTAQSKVNEMDNEPLKYGKDKDEHYKQLWRKYNYTDIVNFVFAGGDGKNAQSLRLNKDQAGSYKLHDNVFINIWDDFFINIFVKGSGKKIRFPLTVKNVTSKSRVKEQFEIINEFFRGNRHEDHIYKTKRKIIDPFERDQVRTIFNTIKTIIEEDAKKSKISFTD